jgi:HD-like signal output (HDOD) protein
MKAPQKAEEIYGAAMMHDVGMLVMDRFCPDELDQVIARAQKERRPIHEIEASVHGYDHAVLGGLLADRWGLTGMIRGAVRYHHNADADPEDKEATTLVAVANALAHQCGFTNNVSQVQTEMPPALLEAIGMPAEQLDVIRVVVIKEIEQAQEAFQIK